MTRDVKHWLVLFGIFALMAAVVLGYYNLPQSRYDRIGNGMTLEEVRIVMGRNEDASFPFPSWATRQAVDWDTMRKWNGSNKENNFNVFFDRGRVVGKQRSR
jgi:hypothetical protein